MSLTTFISYTCITLTHVCTTVNTFNIGFRGFRISCDTCNIGFRISDFVYYNHTYNTCDFGFRGFRGFRGCRISWISDFVDFVDVGFRGSRISDFVDFGFRGFRISDFVDFVDVRSPLSWRSFGESPRRSKHLFCSNFVYYLSIHI